METVNFINKQRERGSCGGMRGKKKTSEIYAQIYFSLLYNMLKHSLEHRNSNELCLGAAQGL